MQYQTLRDVRKRAGLTCAEVGEQLGVSGSLVGRYENGVVTPDLKAIRKLASLYGMASWELIRLLENQKARGALWDYSAGDVGIYQECGCGVRVLLPPGAFYCPSCGKDSLIPVDIGNGLGGIAALNAVLNASDTPDLAYPGNPSGLKRVDGAEIDGAEALRLIPLRSCEGREED